MVKTKTIELEVENVWLDIEYSYTEGEKEVTYYPDGSGSPASAPRVDVYSVEAGGVDITEIISDYVFNDIEEQIYKTYED